MVGGTRDPCGGDTICSGTKFEVDLLICLIAICAL